MIRYVAIILSLLACLSPAIAQQTVPDLLKSLADRDDLKSLKTVIVAQEGEVVAEEGYRGHRPSQPTNIKSASKSIVSALVGIAIDKGLLTGPEQKIAPILKSDLPSPADPRISDITIGNLLSMQAGLGRLSGPNYGRWVSSRNWVRFALARPFDAEPGGRMLYSTASTHLLSAILTKVGGKSTLTLAREWLGPVDGFRIDAWSRDPQGIYLGGNEMAMTARSLLAFGELYRNRGRTADGRQIIPDEWIDLSWQEHTNSRFSGDAYGYGWFNRQIGGEDVHFAWGYGGQMLYIVPALKLTVVMTSEQDGPSARTGYRDALHGVLANIIDTLKAD
ncbi:serine hydrolase domain-containing protein [Sinorhizobium sojae]|uniref:serine hydrolase domain-containing protein n=1 Tax=Sinorhizobium sojae TaxID=716925 RepID=UPI0005521FDB|nr:serine hydrolase [Sinorhizobium sojae]